MMEGEPTFEELVARLDTLLAPCLAQDWPNLPVDRAEGVYVYGHDRRRYLDFLAGFGACNVGHNHPRIVAAAREQMERVVHAPAGVMAHEPLLRLAWELRRIAPGQAEMFFFSNSGSEAIDGALKLARYAAKRPAIIAFLGGFHGRTMGAVAVTTSKVEYRTGHGPLLPNVYFARFPYPYRSSAPDEEACVQESLEDIERLFEYVISPDDVAAFLVEPVQGEGGIHACAPAFLRGLRELCDEKDLLLIFDEVQTGVMRTGELFAYMGLGIEPDMDRIMAAHELYRKVANGARDDAMAMQYLIPGWQYHPKRPSFGRAPV